MKSSQTAIRSTMHSARHSPKHSSITTPTRLGLAVLSGGLAFVGSASAAEILVDGSFENTVASSSGTVKVGGAPSPAVGAGWSTFSTYLYSTRYTQNPPAEIGRASCRERV